jgi:hypothetical protein
MTVLTFDAISSYFVSNGVHPSPAWLEALSTRNFTSEDALYSEFLNTDIARTSVSLNLHNPDLRRTFILGAPLIVQIDEIVDVTAPKALRERLLFTDHPTFKVIVNDAGNFSIGVVQTEIPGLSDSLPGVKVMIAAGTVLHYGAFVLSPDNTRILGGSSPELVANRDAFREQYKRLHTRESFEVWLGEVKSIKCGTTTYVFPEWDDESEEVLPVSGKPERTVPLGMVTTTVSPRKRHEPLEPEFEGASQKSMRVSEAIRLPDPSGVGLINVHASVFCCQDFTVSDGTYQLSAHLAGDTSMTVQVKPSLVELLAKIPPVDWGAFPPDIQQEAIVSCEKSLESLPPPLLLVDLGGPPEQRFLLTTALHEEDSSKFD